MSIDLNRSLVQLEGNLDPIDRYHVFSLLQRMNEDGKSVLAKKIVDQRVEEGIGHKME